MGKGKVVGLHHAGITVSDFAAAVSWYHQMFGCVLVNELEFEANPEQCALYGVEGPLHVHLGFLSTPTGANIEIFEFSPQAEADGAVVWNKPGATHIAFEVHDVPAVRSRLIGQGVRFLTSAQESGGAHWAFCEDPDGNRVEIIDLHAAGPVLRWAGGVVGQVLRRGPFAKYYRS